jgi:acyl carrier protein
MDTIEIQVKRVIANFVSSDSSLITNDDILIDKLNIDSLERVELMFNLEDAFPGMVISDEEALKVVTVQDAINLVTSLLSPV